MTRKSVKVKINRFNENATMDTDDSDSEGDF